MTHNSKKKDIEYLLEAINQLEVDNFKKLVIKNRFIELLNKYKGYSSFYVIFFDFGRLSVTLGSISIPALLSLETYVDRNVSFWLVWSISLVVSLINGYITLFKLDKKYYMNIATIEKLNCEFWQYIALCGRYSGTYGTESPTHDNQFVYFTNNIERIQLKNIEEIYIKMNENSKQETKDNEAVPSITEKGYKEASSQRNTIQEEAKITSPVPQIQIENAFTK